MDRGRNTIGRVGENVFLTPTHGILTTYPWYFNPPIHGILTPYPWHIEHPSYLLIKNEGSQNTMGFNLPYRGVSFQ
jgi:hypothetical protein